MKYMDLLRNRAIIETYFYTIVLLVKRNTVISFIFLSDVYVLIIYDGWLVVLRLNVPVNSFSVMSGRSHRFLGN